MMLRFGFLLFTFLNLPTAFAWAPLSSDMYVLPEDRPASYAPVEAKEAERGKFALFHALDEIFSANAEALDGLEKETYGVCHRGKFKLGSIYTELGVSVKGILAPLSLKGTATVTVGWSKRAKVLAPALEDSRPPEILIDSESTRDETYRQLEPMIQVALATRQVKDEKNLRKNLEETATTFYEMSRALDGDKVLSQWWVARFRVDVWVDVLGTVHPGIQVGAGFKLRFEWHRLQPRKRFLQTAEAVPPSPMQEKFRTFVEQLAVDAQEVSFKAMDPTGFYPTYIKVGIGFSATQNIGIVQWSGGVAGFLYLFTDAKPHKRKIQAKTEDSPLFILERDPNARHLAYAQANGIAYETTAKSGGLIREVIYKLERARFRRGLRRAVKMSSKIASRAQRIRNKKWRISSLTTAFDLSIGGEFVMVSIRGTGSIEISYNNGNS